MLLQKPNSSDYHIHKYLQTHVAAVQKLMRKTVELEDTNVSFTLLRSCSNGCKMRHLLRTVHTRLMRNATSTFDSALEIHSISSLGCATCDKETELCLLVKLSSFSVDLGSSEQTTSVAFLASTALLNPIIKMLINGRLKSNPSVEDAVQTSFNTWALSVNNIDKMTLQQIL